MHTGFPPLPPAPFSAGRVLSYPISAQDGGKRVQDYLMKHHGYSIRLIRRLKQLPGSVCLSKGPVRMVERLGEGDTLTICLPLDSAKEAGQIPSREPSSPKEEDGCEEIRRVPILYEDEDVLVYNKPPFLAIHPCRDYQKNTLAEVFFRDMQERGVSHPVFRPVYRLDRDTDGLCIIAKNTLAAAKLARAVEKDYTAIACGRVEPLSGTIDAPIAQLEPHRMKRGIREDGQWAVTHYEVLAYGHPFPGETPPQKDEHQHTDKSSRYTTEGIHHAEEDYAPVYTLLRLRLETGRTHQIRVHLSHRGNPLAGDSLYGGLPSGISRQALSCTRVAFQSPASGKDCEICINMQHELTFLLQNE